MASILRTPALTPASLIIFKIQEPRHLAIALGCRGRRVVLFDADMGMANLDVLCGLTPTGTLEDVVRGRTTLREILVQGPGGFQLVPGASGVASMANIDGLGRRRLLKQLAMLDTVADHLLIDMGAGISSSVMSFAAAADRVVVVTTPEEFEALYLNDRVRIGDVANVTLGPDPGDSTLRANGKTGIGLGIIRQAKSNTLEISQGVRQATADLQQILPDGVDIRVTGDDATFISGAIRHYIALQPDK